MGFAKTEEEWGLRAAAFLKAEMKKAGVTYTEMAKRLKKHGFKDESESTITMKLKRASFGAAFLLASLAAFELAGVRLEDV
jgi:propanediol dehydratase large subunit